MSVQVMKKRSREVKQVSHVHTANKYMFKFPREDLGNDTSESKKKKVSSNATIKESPLKTSSF